MVLDISIFNPYLGMIGPPDYYVSSEVKTPTSSCIGNDRVDPGFGMDRHAMLSLPHGMPHESCGVLPGMEFSSFFRQLGLNGVSKAAAGLDVCESSQS